MASEEEEEEASKPKLNPFTARNAPKPTHPEQASTLKLDDDDVVLGDGLEMKKNCVVTEEEAIRVKEKIRSYNNTKTPAFVEKTFEMVEDPESDPLVSWTATRDSFVVWDSHEFSKTLLPKYFNHSNFLSFIHQLNTYGFRKVDPDRWEFANEAFMGGKKHLLKNIKSRSNKCKKLHQGSSNSMKPSPEDEVEKFKKDLNLMKVEILNLKQQLENSDIELSNVEEQIRCAELKQHQILYFLTIMVKNPILVEHLIKKLKIKEELDGVDMVKRPTLQGTTTSNVENRHQGSELCSSRQEGLRAIGSEASVHDASFADDVMSEKLMGESSVVDEEVDVNDSDIYLELEDLIGSPSELMRQTR